MKAATKKDQKICELKLKTDLSFDELIAIFRNPVEQEAISKKKRY